MADWKFELDVPTGTVLTEETIDGFLQAFQTSGLAMERDTSFGTYPVTSWTSSEYRIPESVLFGTKKIPGVNPFYFVVQPDSRGILYSHFGQLDK